MFQQRSNVSVPKLAGAIYFHQTSRKQENAAHSYPLTSGENLSILIAKLNVSTNWFRLIQYEQCSQAHAERKLSRSVVAVIVKSL